MNETASKLWPALLRARQALGPIAKSATNPHYKSKYAPLGEVLAAVLPAAHGQGLVVVAGIVSLGPNEPPALRVQVIHAETGEATASDVPLVGATTPQLLKSAQTYALRTGLEALFMAELDDDDDGNAASGTQAPARRAQAPKASASAPPSAPPANGRPAGQGRPSEAPARSVARGATPVGKWSCPTCGGQSVFSNKESGKMYCWMQAGGCGAEWKTREAWDAAHPPVAPKDDADTFLSDL